MKITRSYTIDVEVAQLLENKEGNISEFVNNAILKALEVDKLKSLSQEDLQVLKGLLKNKEIIEKQIKELGWSI